MNDSRRIRVLVAKPGLDGHDVGAKVVVRSLMEAGFDVTYTGLRQSPDQIAQKAKEIDADVIGFSILSGSHLPFCGAFKALRGEYGLDTVLWIVGGVIPDKDRQPLMALGVDGVFPVDTPLESLVSFIRERIL